MTMQELAQCCVDSLNHPERSKPDKPLVTLSGKRGGLFPKGGGPRPKRLLCVNHAGEYTYHYDAMNVLAALVAHGAITLADQPTDATRTHSWELNKSW